MTTPPMPRKPTPVERLPGLALAAALSASAIALSRIDWLASHGFSALTLAIVFGIVIGNTAYPMFAERCRPGIDYSRQTLLRLGVILYGLRLTLQDVGHVGLPGIVIDTVMLSSTFALAVLIGTRWLGMDRTSAMLIGAGSSICGAAAVMAAEPVVKGRPEQVTVAVATVVVFGTLGMFLYPQLLLLNHFGAWVPSSDTGFGLYAGSTIHEVAQVIAAARTVSQGAADTAVIAKMVRVMMLAPFLLALSAWLARDSSRETLPRVGPDAAIRTTPKLTIPWFAFAFIGVVIFNSLDLLPTGVVHTAIDVDTALLAMAMAALGLTTHVNAVRRAGARPLLLALVLFAWLVVGGALVNHWVPALLH